MARTTPPCLTALGRRSLPTRIQVEGRSFTWRKTFKHDFFAVTALYEGEGEKVILKIGRQAGFAAVPLRWLGRLLTARERTAMLRLDDLDGVPRLVGSWGRTGLVREYIEGHPLARGERVANDFFPRLTGLISVIHERGMAYVDLEKAENVLVGDDGRPYLFDFQISWILPARWGGELWPARRLRRWLQAGDRYHVLKLQRRTRPDQLSTAVLAASYRKPWYLRLHGMIVRPVTRLRRRILSRVDPSRGEGERGRVQEEKMIGAA